LLFKVQDNLQTTKNILWWRGKGQSKNNRWSFGWAFWH